MPELETVAGTETGDDEGDRSNASTQASPVQLLSSKAAKQQGKKGSGGKKSCARGKASKSAIAKPPLAQRKAMSASSSSPKFAVKAAPQPPVSKKVQARPKQRAGVQPGTCLDRTDLEALEHDHLCARDGAAPHGEARPQYSRAGGVADQRIERIDRMALPSTQPVRTYGVPQEDSLRSWRINEHNFSLYPTP